MPREGPSTAEVVELDIGVSPELATNYVAVDAASASLYLGGNIVGIAALSLVSPEGLVLYPALLSGRLSGPPFISTLICPDELPTGVTDRYVELGIPYRDDPYVDPATLESDVRLALEVYGLGVAVASRFTYVLVDGPLTPVYRSYSRQGYWLDELALYFSKRARLIREAADRGKVVVGVVKRVAVSDHLLNVPEGSKPVAVGPVVLAGDVEVCSYLLVGRNAGYSHAVARVEIPCCTAEALGPRKLGELLSAIFSSYNHLALPVPYGIYVADKVSKGVTRKIVELVELTAKSRGVLAVHPGEMIYG